MNMLKQRLSLAKSVHMQKPEALTQFKRSMAHTTSPSIIGYQETRKSCVIEPCKSSLTLASSILTVLNIDERFLASSPFPLLIRIVLNSDIFWLQPEETEISTAAPHNTQHSSCVEEHIILASCISHGIVGGSFISSRQTHR